VVVDDVVAGAGVSVINGPTRAPLRPCQARPDKFNVHGLWGRNVLSGYPLSNVCPNVLFSGFSKKKDYVFLVLR
jgi:hypothetical protein